MCSLTGEHSSSSRSVCDWEWWPGRHNAAPRHTDRWSQAPTLACPCLHVSPYLHLSRILCVRIPVAHCTACTSRGWRLSWRAWQQWAGVRAPHCSRANIHCNKKYSLMACTHHTPQPQTLDTLRHPVYSAAVLQPGRGWEGDLPWLEAAEFGEESLIDSPPPPAVRTVSCCCLQMFILRDFPGCVLTPQPEICHSEGGGRGAGDIMEEFYWNWTIPNMSPLSCQEEDWVFNHFGIHLILSWVLLINLFVIIWHVFFSFQVSWTIFVVEKYPVFYECFCPAREGE